MLRLQSISLFQFKNYQHAEFRFDARITGIYGRNGAGKTNLLDAIYYCCFGKSYFSRSEAIQVNRGAQGFRLEAIFNLNEATERLVCILRESGKKEVMLNDEPYSRLAQHVGRYPCIMIVPDDVQIITGASDERRRFLDGLLSQLDAGYLTNLLSYNKIIQQKNSYLRQEARSGKLDNALLDVYDGQLLAPAAYIHQSRQQKLQQLIPLTDQFYRSIADADEEVKLIYESQLSGQDFWTLLRESRARDQVLLRSTTGIHRDEILIRLKDHSFKSVASQGQRKSLLFAMKLAAFEMLKLNKGFAPLLLLDDVFEKLDAHRMHNLLEYVCIRNEGQVLITDTHGERIQEQLQAFGINFNLIKI